MKNLENYGVHELNTKEIKETDGGTLATGSIVLVRNSMSLLAHAAQDFATGMLERFNRYR